MDAMGRTASVAGPARRGPGRPTLSNEQLLDTALDLFLERGFERTSIEAICAAAGMAKRTVYARYGDKTTLFRAALTRAIEEWIVPIDRLRALETDDLEETLLGIGQVLVANVMSPAGLRLLRLTNAESVHMPDVAIFNVQRGTEPTLAYLADLFHRRLGQDGNGVANADEVAAGFLNLVVGGVASNAAWGMVLPQEAIDRHTSYSVRLFLYGLLPHGDGAAEDENRQLRRLLTETADLLARAQERLASI
jgi:AcrR family transcriptional regulator